jgi:DNA-binding GntR family transcriptional regulator
MPDDQKVAVVESVRLAARAAQRSTRADAAALHRVIVDMRAAIRQTEPLTYSDLNARLHTMIRELGGHETAARLLRQLRDQTVRHRFTLALVPGRPAVSLRQHEAIVAAVAAHDSAGAELGMREHLASVIDALQDLPAHPLVAAGQSRAWRSAR